jgi:uncharacterized protein YyaL (SSP411 family)
VDELRRSLAECRGKLQAARERRVKPARDEKILTAWNGLMIEAMAQAGGVLGNETYTGAAARAADFILNCMRGEDGRLLRTCTVGTKAKLTGYQEDYAFLINGLVALYEATFEPRWLKEAGLLADLMTEEFWDPAEGGFYFTSRHHEQLPARQKDSQDSSIPSGNATAVTALLRLAKLLGRSDLWDKADKTLRRFAGLLNSSPIAAGQMLVALDFYVGPVDEVAVVGDPGHPDVGRALKLIRRPFRPNKIIAQSSGVGAKAAELIPLLRGKTSQVPVTTYICRDYACQKPIYGIEDLDAALRQNEVASGK